MRVLVVDDDAVTCEILVEDLRQFGYDVTTATNGREAFELVRTGQFHLIVSDWQMPEMSGLELCREIRKRQWSGYIYVILLTSHAGADNVVCGLNAGADDFSRSRSIHRNCECGCVRASEFCRWKAAI